VDIYHKKLGAVKTLGFVVSSTNKDSASEYFNDRNTDLPANEIKSVR